LQGVIFLKCILRGRRALPVWQWNVVENSCLGKNHGLLDGIFQLPYIPRPGMGLQFFQRLGGNFRRRFVVAPGFPV